MNTLNKPQPYHARHDPTPDKHRSQPRSMLRSILTSLALCLFISLILLALYWQNLYKNIPSSDSSQRAIHVEQTQSTETRQTLSQTEPSYSTRFTDQLAPVEQVDESIVDKKDVSQPLSIASQQALMQTLALNDKADTDTALAKHHTDNIVDNVNELFTDPHKTNETHPNSQHTISNDSPTDHVMRVQTRHIPTSHTQKMTDLLPDELKQNIKQSLLSDEQVRHLNSEERKAYKRTQREIVRTLRELAGLEAENQHLKGMINEKEQTNESLNKEILALRQYFK